MYTSLLNCGIVDTHYHIGPEIIPRLYDVAGLAEAARACAATIVLKNHTFSTTPLAALARARYGVRFYGGMVLNRYVGGLNIDAIYGAIAGNHSDPTKVSDDPAPIMIWMPTVHAVSHLRTLGHSFDPRWSGCCRPKALSTSLSARTPAENERPVVVFDEDYRPQPELLDVLDVIADNRCVLATGHLAGEEIMHLVPMAKAHGITHIIITHPQYPSVNLKIEQLRDLSKYDGVFFEHCFAVSTIEGVPLQSYIDAIRATGPDHVVLSTDFGQVVSDEFPAGTLRYANEMENRLRKYYSPQKIRAMFTHNGLSALGLL